MFKRRLAESKTPDESSANKSLDGPRSSNTSSQKEPHRCLCHPKQHQQHRQEEQGDAAFNFRHFLGQSSASPLSSSSLSYERTTPTTALLNPAIPPHTQLDRVLKLTVRPRIWSRWRLSEGQPQGVVYTGSNRPFPLQLDNCVGAHHDGIILRNPYDGSIPCAMMLKKHVFYPETFELFAFHPLLAIPPNSKHHHQHHDLQQPSKNAPQPYRDVTDMYQWGSVVVCKENDDAAFNKGENNKNNVTEGNNITTRASQIKFFHLELVDGTCFKVFSALPNKKTSGLGGNCRYEYAVTRNDRPCGRFERPRMRCVGIASDNSWNIHIGPGIDPTLMVALVAVVDKAIDYW
ncbi:hypothetical protein ACA910_020962 [Epithemia clementina (nom. ined.)]